MAQTKSRFRAPAAPTIVGLVVVLAACVVLDREPDEDDECRWDDLEERLG